MREFMYSLDMAEACVYLVENIDISEIEALTSKSPKEKKTIHFLNIGTGHEISIKALASLIKQKLGFAGGLYFNSDKPDGPLRKLTNVDLLHSLGYKHNVELEQGIEKMYKAYLEKQ